MTTKAYKVYGAEGHRQRESFAPSKVWEFSEGEDIRIIEIINSDRTGTNDFTIIRITRNTPEECERELQAQISDGVFENSRTGKIEPERTFLNFDTGETWTESEIIEAFFSESELSESFRTADNYIEFLMKQGQEKTGGIVEI